MTSIRPAVAITAALLLAACGRSQDASTDATSDTVEAPADAAMANAPMPAEDTGVVEDSAQDAAPVATVEKDAQQAADDAQSAVDDAVSAAETSADSDQD